MNSKSEEKSSHSNEPVFWLQLLPRWSLVTSITTIVIPLLFLGGVGQNASDNTLGQEFVELLQAARTPFMFRAAWAIDAIVWLMLGGILITFSGLLRCSAPISSVFIFTCGLAQMLGAFGSFLRLDGISDIAYQYLTVLPEQKVGLLESYINLSRVINATNHVGVLLQGTGYILVSWRVFSLRGFPRWLAAWIGLPGLLAVTQFGLFAMGASYLFLLNVIGLVAGNIFLNMAIAISLWHPSDILISSIEWYKVSN